ncbi:MAG TPA: hypothetical protein VN616_06435 [Puia sp.]|nr:hypothetical protein [Puia sp.]
MKRMLKVKKSIDMGLGLGRLYARALTGETVIRDFITVGAGDQLRERVYLVADGQVRQVTGNQWLLGLDPRVVGIWDPDLGAKGFSGKFPALPGPCKLYMCDAMQGAEGDIAVDTELTEDAIAEQALGVMELDYKDQVAEHDGTLLLFRVLSTRIRHIDRMRAWLLYQKFYRKPGVTFERLKAVAAAYSYPRRVRIISFRFDDDNNYIFPMDLLADIRPVHRYLLGMRHSNQVLKRILDDGRIVVAEAPANYKQVIYTLGRNHSAAPPPLDQLPFGVISTDRFGFYLPEWVESYKEIRITKTRDLGSHMLLCGEWTEDVILKPATPRLHHLHFLYFLHQKGGCLGYPIVS